METQAVEEKEVSKSMLRLLLLRLKAVEVELLLSVNSLALLGYNEKAARLKAAYLAVKNILEELEEELDVEEILKELSRLQGTKYVVKRELARILWGSENVL